LLCCSYLQAFFSISLAHSENFIFDFLAARLKVARSFGVSLIVGSLSDAGSSDGGLPLGRFLIAFIN